MMRGTDRQSSKHDVPGFDELNDSWFDRPRRRLPPLLELEVPRDPDRLDELDDPWFVWTPDT